MERREIEHCNGKKIFHWNTDFDKLSSKSGDKGRVYKHRRKSQDKANQEIIRENYLPQNMYNIFYIQKEHEKNMSEVAYYFIESYYTMQ